MESHQRDHENYVACSRSHRRRAKALLDFERHDDDELGFRKNDIITVSGAWGASRREQTPTPGLPGPHSCPTRPTKGAAARLQARGLGNQSFASSCSPPANRADHLSEGRALLGRGAERPER